MKTAWILLTLVAATLGTAFVPGSGASDGGCILLPPELRGYPDVQTVTNLRQVLNSLEPSNEGPEAAAHVGDLLLVDDEDGFVFRENPYLDAYYLDFQESDGQTYWYRATGTEHCGVQATVECVLLYLTGLPPGLVPRLPHGVGDLQVKVPSGQELLLDSDSSQATGPSPRPPIDNPGLPAGVPCLTD